MSLSVRIAVTVLLIINVMIVASVTHLLFFANKGARYTAADGARDRQDSVVADLALAARIDQLHALLEDKCRL